MLDTDLAELYQVETRVLIQAVKRNLDRFPEDFMFQLTKEEGQFLRSQIVISNESRAEPLPCGWSTASVASGLSNDKVPDVIDRIGPRAGESSGRPGSRFPKAANCDAVVFMSQAPRTGDEMVLTQIFLNFGNGDNAPFSFRDRSTGDRGVIQQIFVDRNYDLTKLARFQDIASEYERIIARGRTPLIIDCGANIGASPIWFARSFPKAAVFAVEPEEHNYEILRLNCGEYTNIMAERAAISCLDETVYVQDVGAGDWGFRTTNRPTADSPSAPAYSIESIVRRYSNADLFLVKIDIEGGEARLFETNCDWVERAMVIIIELHDWLLPGTANSQNCLKVLCQHKRDFVFAGENAFSIRNRQHVPFSSAVKTIESP
jgi:FkbM family methyltransferase